MSLDRNPFKACIHGRSAKQRCRLCDLRATCCGSRAVIRVNGVLVCEACKKPFEGVTP